MQSRPLGATGLMVSAVGFGAGHVGAESQSEHEIGTLLNRAADRGVTLFDSAVGYGDSEARIGRHLSWRRHELVLSTKVGYGVPGQADWTGRAIVLGVEHALARMKTDFIDLVHLHSCPLDVLVRDDILGALDEIVRSGKVRVAAYSGEGDAVRRALELSVLRSIQLSINVFDQASIAGVLPEAQKCGFGVIAKRPLGNAPWRFVERPSGHYAESYWERMRELEIDPSPLPWGELALRFSLTVPGVSSCIVGTSSVAHLEELLRWAENGPLPEARYTPMRAAFERVGRDWIGLV